MADSVNLSSFNLGGIPLDLNRLPFLNLSPNHEGKNLSLHLPEARSTLLPAVTSPPAVTSAHPVELYFTPVVLCLGILSSVFSAVCFYRVGCNPYNKASYVHYAVGINVAACIHCITQLVVWLQVSSRTFSKVKRRFTSF